MAVSSEIKARAFKAIALEIERVGTLSDRRALHAPFSNDVPESTFYRWCDAVLKSGAPVEKASRKIKRSAVARKSAPKPTREQRKQAVVELDAELPAVVTLADLQTDGFAGVASRIDSCINHAERVLKACEKDDGRIVNPKLYLQASTHILRSMDTASRVVGMLMDAERTRKYNEIMLRRIAARDPEVVRLILADMRALNEQLGVSIG